MGRRLLARLTPAPGAWIESPRYDCVFFVLAPLLILPIPLIEMLGWQYVAIAGGMLAMAHYASTFTFFLWDENRAYHRAHWVAFFAGPVLIGAAYLLLVGVGATAMVASVLFVWNAYHVARQSCGILSVYRHRAGVTDLRQKQIANTAIIGTSLWLAFWNIETHAEMSPWLSFISPQVPVALRLGLGVVAVTALARLAVTFWRRRTAEGRLGLPEAAFAVTSVGLFHPFLWVPTSAGATYVMLLPHYVQYLGLVWLLHRRKFRTPAGSWPQQALHRLSANPGVLVWVLVGIGLATAGARSVLSHAGRAEVFEAFYLTLAFVHFYLDALFWTFKNPHVRRMLAPYLMQGALVPR